MLARGDWVVPHLQGQPYLDKPPLLYWLVMLSYPLFGVSRGAGPADPRPGRSRDDPGRLPARPAKPGRALRVLGRAVPHRRAGLHRHGPPADTGRASDVLGHAWPCFATFEAVRGDRFRVGLVVSRRARGRARGADQGADPATVARPADLAAPPADAGTRCRSAGSTSLGFLGVVAAVNLPWYAAMFLREPVFLRYFFWEHNILRFVKPFDHLQPVWYYLPIVLGGLLPGTSASVRVRPAPAAAAILTGPRRERRPSGSGCWPGLWCVFFFSMSGASCRRTSCPRSRVCAWHSGISWPARAGATDPDHSRRASGPRRPCWCSGSTSRCRGTRNAGRRWATRRSRPGCTRPHDEPMYCFPRNVDSVAFYTDRDDLKSCRTKISQELVEARSRRDRGRSCCSRTGTRSTRSSKSCRRI